MKVRRSRAHKRGRIEIIPMIDVMFFLLATFMLASLAMQNLHSLAVNLPKGEAAAMNATQPITLSVRRYGQIYINETPVAVNMVASTLKPLLRGPNTDVIVAADTEVPQGIVVHAMLDVYKRQD